MSVAACSVQVMKSGQYGGGDGQVDDLLSTLFDYCPMPDTASDPVGPDEPVDVTRAPESQTTDEPADDDADAADGGDDLDDTCGDRLVNLHDPVPGRLFADCAADAVLAAFASTRVASPSLSDSATSDASQEVRIML